MSICIATKDKEVRQLSTLQPEKKYQ